MALPTVAINSGSGSDTAASGAGPSTAITGTTAITHANTTINISDAVALGGVAVDGSAVLWVNSSSGRQFSKITAITGSSGAWVVTVESAYANSETKTWGIGGKRATMAGSARLFVDWALAWTVDVQTGETFTASITFTAPTPDGTTLPPLVTSTTYTTWGTQPLLQTATNSLVMFKVGTTGLSFENLQFKSTAATPATAFQATQTTGNNLSWRNCLFDGFLMAIDGANSGGWEIRNSTVACCEIKNCTQASSGSLAALSLNNGGGGNPNKVSNCWIHDNVQAFYGVTTVIDHCVFTNNTSARPIINSMADLTFTNNSLYNNGSGASTAAGSLSNSGAGTGKGNLTIANNIFWGSKGYAVELVSGNEPQVIVNVNNAYGGNNGAATGLDRLNMAAGASAVALTVQPYVSTSTPDWGLNSTAGGGAACKGKAATVPGASANTAGDLGAIPSGGGAASGGVTHLAGRGGGLVA